LLTLGIDTATKVCSVAICRDEEILAAYEINMGMTHSEGLVPQLEQIFARTRIDKNEIDLVAVSIGPGSFTGLRIGLATAEAIAYSLKIPLVGVNTLEALAYNLPVEGMLLAPILDAQKGNYYLAVYEWKQGKIAEVAAVRVVHGSELGGILSQYNRKVVLLGECTKIASMLPSEIMCAPRTVSMPKATSVAVLGVKQHLGKEDRQYFGLEPFYIRRSEAEELWEQRQKNLAKSDE
jgi:tRNA threonylcarbamoyladenosine biosynthesis protein TsaB